MAKEIQYCDSSGVTAYDALLVGPTGKFWNRSTLAWETYSEGNWANYAAALTQQGTSGIFLGDMPAGLGSGVVRVIVVQRVGGSPAATDPVAGETRIHWDGTQEISLHTILGRLKAVDTVTTKTTLADVVIGDDWRPTALSGLDLSDAASLSLTLKTTPGAADSASQVWIDTITGLKAINGAAATAGNGSITFDTAAGTAAPRLKAVETAKLAAYTGVSYALRKTTAGGVVTTVASGTLDFAAE